MIEADLTFELDLPDGRSTSGRLSGHGRRLRLTVEDPDLFAGSADAAAVAGVAAMVAERGLVVEVVHHDATLLCLGDVRVPWWHRRITRSRHIRLGSLRALISPGRSRLRGDRAAVLPDSRLTPPPTLYPLVPTFHRRRRVTTTHDPARGGDPRLRVHSHETEGVLPPSRPFRLQRERTTIGSDESCDIRLDGLEPLHAEIVHDELDEFTVVAHHRDVRVHGGPAHGARLRQGSSVAVGPWTLIYSRDEHADHGRPFGGRIGGELGRQLPQPPRDTQTSKRR